MGRSHTIIRAVTTNLTRSSSLATMDSLAASILALFKAGGAYDLGIDRAWVQWDGTDLDVVLEDDAMAAPAADISTRNTTIKNGLESLTPQISAVDTANIETVEQSALSVDDDVIIGVDYAADAWPGEYFSDPQSLPSGWTVDTTGGAPDTTASYPAVGDGYSIQLVSDSDGVATIEKTFSGLTSATTWEIRCEFKANNLTTSAQDYTLNVRDGTRRFAIHMAATGVYVHLTAAIKAHALTTGDWVTVTVRREGDYVKTWIGPDLVDIRAYTALPSDTTTPGRVLLGNTFVGARTANIRMFGLKLNSVNEAPPEYTFMGTTNGR